MITRRRAFAGAALATAQAVFAHRRGKQDRFSVVATFSILADLRRTSAVTGDCEGARRTERRCGMFISRAPSDAKIIRDAKLVIVNGLGFEGWMGLSGQGLGNRWAAMVTATQGRGRARRTRDGHRRGADPHARQSVPNAKIYVANIRDALVAGRSGRSKSAYERECHGLSCKA